MKFVIVFAAILAVAVAGPINSKDAEVVRYDSDVGVEGYKFAVETSDGSTRTEQGQLKNIGTENEAIVVSGSFSWIGDDGQTYTIKFVADENGYRPEGAHLPVAPDA